MMKKFVSEKKRTAALLACIIGLTLVAGCASGDSSKAASESAPAAAEEQAAEPAAAVAEEQSAEPGAAAEESSDPARPRRSHLTRRPRKKHPTRRQLHRSRYPNSRQ